MKKLTDPSMTLTEARRKNGVTVIVEDAGGSSSSSRRTPYVERYGHLSGLYETPIEQLQRAAEDEAGRRVETT